MPWWVTAAAAVEDIPSTQGQQCCSCMCCHVAKMQLRQQRRARSFISILEPPAVAGRAQLNDASKSLLAHGLCILPTHLRRLVAMRGRLFLVYETQDICTGDIGACFVQLQLHTTTQLGQTPLGPHTYHTKYLARAATATHTHGCAGGLCTALCRWH